MELEPLEDELTSHYLGKREKFALGKINDKEAFVAVCLHEVLALVDDWTSALPDAVRELFLRQSSAKNTLKAYRSDLVVFWLWCLEKNKCPLPCDPVTLVEFLAEDKKAGRKLSTIKRRASSISWIHRKAGYLGQRNPRENPFVKESIINLCKINKDEKVDKAVELSTDLIREMVTLCKEEENKVKGARDRALLLLGFASAMRRENLSQIRLEEINIVIQGLEIFIPSSKTDQRGRGHVVRLARGQVPTTCPVMSLKDWIDISGIEEGHIFRRVFKDGKLGDKAIDPKTVSRVIQGLIGKLEIKEGKKYSAHSLRSGFASTAAQNGASIQSIKTQGNWKSDGSLMRYIRNREDWEVAASYKLGL